MATGTIKNQFTGTWTSVNTNLKYQVRSGIVFVWILGGNSHTDWTTVGTLPSNVRPSDSCYNSTFTDSATARSNFYISTNGTVQHLGNSGASTIMSYPLS